MTLADVAAESGIAPATLIQRFGSKRGLLLALAQQGVEVGGDPFAAARTIRGPRVNAFIVCFAECCELMAPDPVTLSNHLAFLQIDLTDRDFHRLALAQARGFHRQIRDFLDELVRSRELKPCDTDALARVVQLTYGGSMLAWAIERQGRVGDWVRRDLEFILAPYRSHADRPSNRRRTPAKKVPAGARK